MPSVLLVRHAQASHGAADYDVLSALGRRQATVLAAELQRRGLAPARVVSGTLRRQRDTLHPFAETEGVTVEEDEGWNEYDAGDILAHHGPVGSHAAGDTAVAASDMQTLLGGGLAAWITAGSDGPTREPYSAFVARVHAALRRVLDGLGPGESALVCSSGGTIGCIGAALLGMGPTGLVTLNRVSVNTGLTRVVAGARGATLVTFNEHAHLERDGAALRTY